jgi:hypothetical protein
MKAFVHTGGYRMFLLCFGGVIVVGFIFYVKRDSGSCRRFFIDEAEYVGEIRKTEQELEQVKERALHLRGAW